MTVWTVERDARGWSVVQYVNGERITQRRTLTGLSCKSARVIRCELENAYMVGRNEERADISRAMVD
jgi:hypothetical protein